MKKKHYLSIAVFSYILFFIVTIPIGTVLSTINDSKIIKIRGASGTIWNGQAVQISINKNIILSDTEWSFNAWKTFIGQIAFQINTHHDQQDITGEVAISFLQQYSVNDLTAKISAEKVATLANIPLVQLSGMINLDIDHAHWKQGNLPLAYGKIIWQNANVTVAETASLGNVTITLSETEQDLLNADISSKGGDILIDGIAGLIPEADYTVDLKLTPTAQANDNIRNSLSLFAKKQSNGSFLLKKTGRLNQFGLQ